MDIGNYPCPLCVYPHTELYWQNSDKVNWELYSPTAETPDSLCFFRCTRCELIFKDPAVLPQGEKERLRYLSHENDPEDPHYANYLSRLSSKLLPYLRMGMRGLDFGCGPTRGMSALFAKEGYECLSFDPYFFPNSKFLNDHYDFITCSEVVEHFYAPKKAFDLLATLLKPQSCLAIMTQSPPADFPRWWYHKDPTHAVFYGNPTFDWIAKTYGYKLYFHDYGVVLLEKV